MVGETARPVILLITTSLDGFIADLDGGVEWLLAPSDDVPADYLALIRSIDCLVMGSATYETSLVLKGGTEVFSGREVYVFTSRDDLPAHPNVTFVHGDATDFTRSLRAGSGGAIWLFGGGRLATALSDAGLVDEYFIAVQPVLLGDGIPLWVTPHGRTALELTSARAWPDGIAELRYRPAKPRG
jgi:dihydrofolate reductase